MVASPPQRSADCVAGKCGAATANRCRDSGHWNAKVLIDNRLACAQLFARLLHNGSRHECAQVFRLLVLVPRSTIEKELMAERDPSAQPPLVLIANDQEWSARSLESILAPNGYADGDELRKAVENVLGHALRHPQINLMALWEF